MATSLLTPLRAEVSEPDNILFGTVLRDSGPITATDTDVMIEARRMSDDVVVARYQMGENPRARDHYTLRIPLESFIPVLDSLASSAGTGFIISASDFSGEFVEVPFTMGERGQFQQLNLNNLGGFDSDGDGMLDEWELVHFGNLFSSPNTDTDNDGVTDGDEYVAGTNPNNPESLFTLDVTRASGTGLEVSFQTQPTGGAGYQAKIRNYTLESTTDPGAAVWQAVPGYENLQGNGQTVSYAVPDPDVEHHFFRVFIQLTDVGPPLP